MEDFLPADRAPLESEDLYMDNGANIAKDAGMADEANIVTTRFYNHRKIRSKDSPTFKVSY